MDNIIGTSPVIAVLRAADASDYAPVVETLINNQVTTIELTLTTPRTLELLPELMAQFQDRAHIGVGTVLNAQDAETALSAGAKFIIAPNFNAEVLKVAGERYIPGVFSPTEVATAIGAGCKAVKIFPAQTVGAGYLKHLRGPFPGLQAIPSGGVDLEQTKAWMKAGSPAVSVGGPLLGDVFSTQDYDALARRTRQFVEDLGA
ncbi:MAG TPA: 2-dehydro-3-deoxyphosphogluconate aldolase [Corynebacterium stationis]|nr:2-dehydro-3-deoxyphosphogluconate aldolase [Corynebacterium stationis]